MEPFRLPPEFRTREIATNGTSIYVRSGGTGTAVVLLHGYGETGDMWAPMAVDLARDHTVVVPDLRGMGLSSKPAGGFDKKTQAGDVAGVLDQLKIDRADLVTHDIGNMVGYAFAAQYPDRGGPDMERLVEGRERIYLDRFWNEFSANPARFSEAARTHYSKLYATPGAMHSGFMQFAAFDQDAVDNQQLLAKGKLRMPVLAIGGEKSFGTTMAKIMQFAATNVREGVIPDSGHWIMEENPTATISMVRSFLDANS
jgi:pimeloyl-ACP methyl ester carboxylesterase